MTAIKTGFKKILEKTATASLGKRAHFKFKKLLHFLKNQQFKKNNPSLAIPPDEYLFETFQLDYQKYFADGNLAAKEILDWTREYIPEEMPTILDWGCGTGRITQHLHQYNPYALLYGADINQKMIDWDHQNIKDVHFSLISSDPPTDYPANYFDLVYGISVFTHLTSKLQDAWMVELQRIIKPSSILLITTHGSFFHSQLLQKEKKQLAENGFFEKAFHKNHLVQSGDRNDTMYVTETYFKKIIEPDFDIKSFYDGSIYPEKFGGQDLWILQKK
ncbi:MAG: class I SAM-dependent methyltransferase [Bacteroidetes bacterium]|nr:class I SAM-dependent methyltransferase [Bacteroidota bacterium]